MRVTETDTGTHITRTVTDTSLTLTSLHPYYVYSFSLAAVTVGIGPYSTAVNVTTDEAGELSIKHSMHMLYALVPKRTVPSGTPRNFIASATSPFEAAFSWVPPPADEQNGIIANYVINITEDNTGKEFQVSTSNTSLTIDDNLQPYYTYICAISAETSVGEGPFSSDISFTTHEHGRLE